MGGFSSFTQEKPSDKNLLPRISYTYLLLLYYRIVYTVEIGSISTVEVERENSFKDKFFLIKENNLSLFITQISQLLSIHLPGLNPLSQQKFVLKFGSSCL